MSEHELDEGLDTDEEIVENEEGYQDDLDDGDEGVGGDDGSEGESHDDDEAEAYGDSGEAGLDAAQGEDSSSNTPRMPPPPEGYTSWEQYGVAAAQRDQRQHDQQSSYDQQAQRYQQVQQAEAARQQQAQQQRGFAWDLPHQMNPNLRMAMRMRGTEGFDKLDEQTRQRANEQHNYVAGNWDRWTYDPSTLADEVVMPRLVPVLRNLTEQLAQLKAAEFQRKHQADLGSQQERERYLEIVQNVQRDPYQVGLEMLRMQRALQDAQQGSQGAKTKTRDRQAQAKSGKGKSVAKGRNKGRRSKRKSQLNKAERGNPAAVAQDVMRQMMDRGELTQAEIDG